MTTRLLRTIFLTSVFSYIGFVYLDYLEPGVVSDVASVHFWLIPIIVSGILWTMKEKGVNASSSRMRGSITAILLGLVLGTILWHNGTMFGDFRLLLAISVAALPSVTYVSLRNI